MVMDVDIDRVVRSPFVIGAAGSLVALRFAPGLTWAERVFNVGAGSICAGICAPALVEWMHVTSPGMQSALSFAIGLFGLSMASALVQGIREVKLGEVITGWISRKG